MPIGKIIKLIINTIVVVSLVFGLVAYPATGNDSLTAPLRDFLLREIGLANDEVEMVIAGRPVAKLLKTKTNDEVAIFGIVKIDAPPELFIKKFTDIVTFESGTGINGIGRFHRPPVIDDVASLQIDKKELEEIPKCKTGDCGIKLSDQTMQYLQAKIDWSSPQAASEAEKVIRQAFVDYVANYQKIGDAALAVYNDKDKPQAIREGFHQLLQNSSEFIQYDPQLANYLEKYPKEKPADTEEIFYWQNGEFGLKPVVRASHVIIHRNQHENYFTYAIAAKTLLASHYFRAALELKSIVPENGSASAKSFYLVSLNRSFVDGLTGVKGSLIRPTVKSKSRDSHLHYLSSVKKKIEAAYRGQ